MRKMLVIGNVLGIIVILLFIIQPFSTAPPTPKVTSGETVIPVTEGSYCWDGPFSGKCVDKKYSSIVAMAGEEQSASVAPGENVTVTFKKQPKKMVAEQWVGDSHVETVEVKDHSIVVPEKEGIYVYHLVAHWKQGDGSYVFSVKVK
ncbi:hypothetical protein LCL96_14470 [Rossellomorea aquimaris]|uniref:hypothetical protein n=1 Tax=Rossellomorea aquimaris TaxID=189382 RepID=UPI001CD38F73|nr:hypothetical protein [Rossellomorea aquimaris]MCA1060139.1 hypothetical protein [Rossellomorea aquimaris]